MVIIGKSKFIQDYVAFRYPFLVNKVIAKYKTFPGQQSDEDSGLENLWDEYKAQVQGEESFLFDEYENLLVNACNYVLSKLDESEWRLLWLGTEDGSVHDEQEDQLPDPHEIREAVFNELLDQVGKRAANDPLPREWQDYLDDAARARFEEDIRLSGGKLD